MFLYPGVIETDVGKLGPVLMNVYEKKMNEKKSSDVNIVDELVILRDVNYYL